MPLSSLPDPAASTSRGRGGPGALAAATLAALTASGCAGVLGSYGPGQTNEQRTSTGCSAIAPGSSLGYCSTRSFSTSDLELGTQLGARLGAASATAGDLGSGTALAVDAHADLTVATERFGAGVSTGYTSDRMSVDDTSYFYSGVPVTLYGQYGVARRLFVHAGLGRVFAGGVKRIEPDEVTVDANAWRGVAGVTFVFGRKPSRDLALRLEVRTQRSGAAAIDGIDATWSSTGLLAEIVWASF